MTCSSTCCIFACLFLNHSDDKSDNSFQQLIENWTRSGQRKIRIPYQLQSIEKAILSSAYLKNYFGSYSNQKHATPTSDSNSTTLDYTEATYVKSRVSSRLGLGTQKSRLVREPPCLDSNSGPFSFSFLRICYTVAEKAGDQTLLFMFMTIHHYIVRY